MEIPRMAPRGIGCHGWHYVDGAAFETVRGITNAIPYREHLMVRGTTEDAKDFTRQLKQWEVCYPW